MMPPTVGELVKKDPSLSAIFAGLDADDARTLAEMTIAKPRRRRRRAKDMLDAVGYRSLPSTMGRLVKSSADVYAAAQDMVLPAGILKVWYVPDDRTVMSYCIPGTEKPAYQLPGVLSYQTTYASDIHEKRPYVVIKRALDNRSVFGPVLQAAQLQESPISDLYGGPNPLAAMLASGVLGAGIGYGGGWLAEKLIPQKVMRRGAMPRLGAILGGLGAAVPGAVWGLQNVREKGLAGLIDRYPFGDKPASAAPPYWQKYANQAGSLFAPRIPVDQFNRAVWNDLRSHGGHTPPHLAAATTGLVEAAALSRGGVNIVSPMDIARIGVGMGSGYLSGMVAGKALGALAGLAPEAQTKLQQAGVWAGMLSNVVPMLFGR